MGRQNEDWSPRMMHMKYLIKDGIDERVMHHYATRKLHTAGINFNELSEMCSLCEYCSGIQAIRGSYQQQILQAL